MTNKRKSIDLEDGDIAKKRVELMKLKMVQLRELLAEADLPIAGNAKRKLVDRLLGLEAPITAPTALPVSKEAIAYGHESIERFRLQKKEQRLRAKTNAELQAILRARAQPVSGTKTQLIARLLGLEERRKLKPIEKSAVAKVLAADIFKGLDLQKNKSCLPLEAEALWHSKDLYRRYGLEEFDDLLEKLRAKHKDLSEQAKKDDDEVLKQLAHVGGMEQTTFWGYQSWRNHPAKRLLRHDMDKGKHKKMMPSQLRLTRPEYCTMEEHVFRRRIHQEVKARKQANWNERLQKEEEEDSRGDVDSEWSDSDEDI